jgi:hypothetical protein
MIELCQQRSRSLQEENGTRAPQHHHRPYKRPIITFFKIFCAKWVCMCWLIGNSRQNISPSSHVVCVKDRKNRNLTKSLLFVFFSKAITISSECLLGVIIELRKRETVAKHHDAIGPRYSTPPPAADTPWKKRQTLTSFVCLFFLKKSWTLTMTRPKFHLSFFL